MSFPSKLLLGFPDGHGVNYDLLPQLIKEGKLEIIRYAWHSPYFQLAQHFVNAFLLPGPPYAKN